MIAVRRSALCNGAIAVFRAVRAQLPGFFIVPSAYLISGAPKEPDRKLLAKIRTSPVRPSFSI
jgi:hypothetical protein